MKKLDGFIGESSKPHPCQRAEGHVIGIKLLVVQTTIIFWF